MDKELVRDIFSTIVILIASVVIFLAVKTSIDNQFKSISDAYVDRLQHPVSSIK